MKKLILSVFVAGLAVAATFSGAAAFSPGEQDCSKCHTLSVDQARDVLKDIIPDVKVLDVQKGPISGIWEVSMESGSKKGVLYVDYSKKNLVAGNIIAIKTKVNFTQTAFDKINKIDVSSLPYENSLVMGDKNAKHKVIVFDDPD
ncbi:MAG: hypothetical protein HZB33_11495 [Nitrospirae bacterium]|nr:hypothetical protein [Nitrospirota bacterium]